MGSKSYESKRLENYKDIHGLGLNLLWAIKQISMSVVLWECDTKLYIYDHML